MLNQHLKNQHRLISHLGGGTHSVVLRIPGPCMNTEKCCFFVLPQPYKTCAHKYTRTANYLQYYMYIG